jgi:hypothetical protein
LLAKGIGRRSRPCSHRASKWQSKGSENALSKWPSTGAPATSKTQHRVRRMVDAAAVVARVGEADTTLSTVGSDCVSSRISSRVAAEVVQRAASERGSQRQSVMSRRA